MKESKFYQEIQDESRVQTRQIDVLEALTVRFGKIAANPFKEAVLLIHDADDLAELHRSAIKCRALDGFRRLLARKVKSQPTSL